MADAVDDIVVIDFTDNGPIVAGSSGSGNVASRELPPGVTSVVVEVVPNGPITCIIQALDGSGQGSVTVDPNGVQVLTNQSGVFKFTVSNLVGGQIGFNLLSFSGTIGSLKVHAHSNYNTLLQAPVAYGATSAVQGPNGQVSPKLVGGGVSGANASNAVILALGPLNEVLDIIMTTSAGTATLTVEGSVDAQTWDTIDNFAAAAKTVKHYNNNTVGAATAVTPLAFPYVRVTAGQAGGGNTTTLKVAAK